MPQYQNYQILSPEGKLMFRTSKKRMDWYVSRNLAKIVDDQGLVAQLLFEPKGPGGINDPFYNQEMINQCVVCGTADDLTRHHLVPYTYRKHFPEELKSNTSYDILALCVNCHVKAEEHNLQLKRQLAVEYNAPFEHGIVFDKNLVKVKMAASTLVKHSDGLPEQRIKELTKLVTDYLGRKPESDDLAELLKVSPYNFDNYKSHAELLFSQLVNLEEFVHKWRKYFLDTMNPKFLPQHWTWDRPLHRSNL